MSEDPSCCGYQDTGRSASRRGVNAAVTRRRSRVSGRTLEQRVVRGLDPGWDARQRQRPSAPNMALAFFVGMPSMRCRDVRFPMSTTPLLMCEGAISR